jgi:hypothetical protein
MIRGRVKDGVVVLDDPKSLPNGAEVSVRVLRRPARKANAGKKKATVRPGLLKLAGKAKDLPPDASVNVEHYLYGHPKR